MRFPLVLSAMVAGCNYSYPGDYQSDGSEADARVDAAGDDAAIDAATDAAIDAGIDAPPLTWSTPVRLAFNTTGSEALPSAAPSGVELFFSSPPDQSTFLSDIYFVTRPTPSDSWGTVRTPVVAVNSMSQTESDSNISADGLELVFRRAGDLYSVRRSSVGGSWGSPATTGLTGSFPNLLADGLNMYYQPSGVSCPVTTCRTRVSRASTSGAWGSPVQEQFPPGGYQMVRVSGDGLRALLSAPSTTTVAPVAISRRANLSAAWGSAEPITELANFTAIKNAFWNWNETEMYLGFTQGQDADIYISRLAP